MASHGVCGGHEQECCSQSAFNECCRDRQNDNHQRHMTEVVCAPQVEAGEELLQFQCKGAHSLT